METKNLLFDLIRIPSESGKEKELGEFILDRLAKNFKIKKQIVDQEKGTFNIFAYVGNPKVLLNAHLDTVPIQTEIKEDEEYIYGRGSCDTKSSIASMIIAAETLLETGEDNFGMLFNVEEETTFRGVQLALDLIPKTVEWIVIGEPTNLKIIQGQKGILTFKLISRGKTAHGSNPELGVNAIEKLSLALIRLKELQLPFNEVLGKNNLNIAKISGGIADNVVPDYAEAEIAIRTSSSSKKILDILIEAFSDFEIQPLLIYDPVLNVESSEIASRIGVLEETASYFTEMYFLSKVAKAFVFGPGEIKDAHTDLERIKKDQLDPAVGKYMEIITLLNSGILNQLD